jgi:ABC-type bacteriocin/lantibiotic exporter with double-glycine peptidase domain
VSNEQAFVNMADQIIELEGGQASPRRSQRYSQPSSVKPNSTDSTSNTVTPSSAIPERSSDPAEAPKELLHVNWGILLRYAREFGYVLLFADFVLILLKYSYKILYDLWLNEVTLKDPASISWGTLTLLIVGYSLVSTSRNIYFFLCSLKLSKRTYGELVSKALTLEMPYLDELTPAGVVSQFGEFTSCVDDRLPSAISHFIAASVILITMTIPYLIKSPAACAGA